MAAWETRPSRATSSTLWVTSVPRASHEHSKVVPSRGGTSSAWPRTKLRQRSSQTLETRKYTLSWSAPPAESWLSSQSRSLSKTSRRWNREPKEPSRSRFRAAWSSLRALTRFRPLSRQISHGGCSGTEIASGKSALMSRQPGASTTTHCFLGASFPWSQSMLEFTSGSGGVPRFLGPLPVLAWAGEGRRKASMVGCRTAAPFPRPSAVFFNSSQYSRNRVAHVRKTRNLVLWALVARLLFDLEDLPFSTGPSSKSLLSPLLSPPSSSTACTRCRLATASAWSSHCACHDLVHCRHRRFPLLNATVDRSWSRALVVLNMPASTSGLSFFMHRMAPGGSPTPCSQV
mmetsp:Transcript_25961/g.75686  ORF Transcript_25961/g.75686 Transcript_25961/m.75686 type:complete len:345 (+) Transcript_25961:1281-2315(+)